MRGTFGKKRIPHLAKNWQRFLMSIGFLIAVPLLPFAFELGFTGTVQAPTLQIATATFAIAVAASSRDLLIFGFGVGMGFIFSATYGNTVHTEAVSSVWLLVTVLVIVLVAVFHGCERYNRHVIDGEPFPEFTKEPEKKAPNNPEEAQ